MVWHSLWKLDVEIISLPTYYVCLTYTAIHIALSAYHASKFYYATWHSKCLVHKTRTPFFIFFYFKGMFSNAFETYFQKSKNEKTNLPIYKHNYLLKLRLKYKGRLIFIFSQPNSQFVFSLLLWCFWFLRLETYMYFLPSHIKPHKMQLWLVSILPMQKEKKKKKNLVRYMRKVPFKY